VRSTSHRGVGLTDVRESSDQEYGRQMRMANTGTTGALRLNENDGTTCTASAVGICQRTVTPWVRSMACHRGSHSPRRPQRNFLL
jgi:hypothetical protein